MRATIRVDGLERIVERGLIPEDEWEKIKRDVAREIDAEIRQTAPQTDEDPQVGFNFKKDWRTTKLPMGTVFGSDYDYWHYVVKDAVRLWRNFAGRILHDFIAEKIAKEDPASHWSVKFYQDSGLGLWENTTPVEFGAMLHGPRVDIGPRADFAAFLERWSYSKTSNAGKVPLFWGIGVMNAIARQLQTDYRGIHTIFMMPVRPKDRSEVKTTPHRKNPVLTFPVIRIVPRHYSRPSTRR